MGGELEGRHDVTEKGECDVMRWRDMIKTKGRRRA